MRTILDVIVAPTHLAADTAQAATRDIPIVYVLLTKPVAPAKLRALIEHLVAASRTQQVHGTDLV